MLRNQNGRKPKRPQTKTATNLNGPKPKRPQYEMQYNLHNIIHDSFKIVYEDILRNAIILYGIQVLNTTSNKNKNPYNFKRSHIQVTWYIDRSHISNV